uniref:Uncharacterized protein n=1 Tax=Timema douglasi TaxID=61478 RepID=A0A7R8VA00_TIMDO|nr:unnamed protein product [Timema douglasi]
MVFSRHRVPRSYAGHQQMSAALRSHGNPCELYRFRSIIRGIPTLVVAWSRTLLSQSPEDGEIRAHSRSGVLRMLFPV